MRRVASIVWGCFLLALCAAAGTVRAADVASLTAEAKAFAEKKDYTSAVAKYEAATAIQQKDPALWVAYGDALNQLSAHDVDYMKRARSAWEKALAIDDDYLPALERMMQFWLDVARLEVDHAQTFEKLGAAAKKLFEADPRNGVAEVAVDTADIRAWVAGVSKDETTIRERIDRLKILAKKYGDDPDVAMYAAQATYKVADVEKRRGRDVEARRLEAESDEIIESALRRSPTAAMYYAAGQVAAMKESTLPTAQRTRTRALYVLAADQVKPDDPKYVEIHFAAARAQTDPAEAEKLLRRALRNAPEDQQARLSLAELLATQLGRREEALQILDQPMGLSNLTGAKAVLARELSARSLAMAANLRIDLYGPANEADRAAMLPKIENSLAMLEQKEGPSARVMRLRGKLLRMQGKRAEAIAALERARQAALRDPAKAGPEMDRWEVIDLLAREYVDTNQLPLARERLEQIMERFPNYDPGRQLLAQTLVKMGDTAAAKPHVERLAQTKPNDPDVIKLKLAVMSTGDAADSNDIRATYSALPETTLAEILDKVNSAMVVKQHDDAQRLLKKAKELAPGDFDMATMGVRVYRVLGDTPAAKTWVDDAIKANPSDERLKVLQKKLMEVAK